LINAKESQILQHYKNLSRDKQSFTIAEWNKDDDLW